MKSSLILGVVLLLTMVTTSIVQARKLAEHTCGDLGPGTNPCKCSEVVVKAAKVQKPLYYASPEAINEAAAVRQATGKFSVETGPLSFPKYNPYTSRTFSTSSSSSSSSSSSTSSSSSSSSSVGILGGFSKDSNVYSPFSTISSVTTSDSGCGCEKKSEPLKVHDLLSSNTHGKIVPSFPPIGDLCYPNPRPGKLQVTTKVTPAYPKIKCSPPIPYEVCVKIMNGQIDQAGLKELGLATAYNSATSSGLGLFKGITGGSVSGSTSGFGGYTSNGVSGRYSNLKKYGLTGIGNSGLARYGSYADSSASSSKVNSFDRYEIYRNKQSADRSNCDFGDAAELPEDYSYPLLPADPVSLTLAYKNLFPRTVLYNKRRFVPEDKLAFGHRTVPTELILGKKTSNIAEEKLQILDKPVVELKPTLPIPVTVGVYDEHEEAKLAELEAIERERINQEEIAEQRQVNFITYGDLGYVPINEIPGKSARPSIDSIDTLDAEDDIETGCGPVGPPLPGYVPGSVVINREFINNESEIEDDRYGSEVAHVGSYVDDEVSEEDDVDDPTSGIFARLRSTAQKYGPLCGTV